MRTHVALLAFLGLASLACGGLFVSDEDRALLSELVGKVEPEQVVPIFLNAGTQVGLVNARCNQCLEPYSRSSTEIRQAMGANALLEASCLCPSTCASERLEDVAVLEPAERMQRVAATCDAEGPDPLFSADLKELRPTVDVIDYAVMRLLVQPLEGGDELEEMRDALAVGLALRGKGRPEASDELTVTGHEADAFEALAPVLTACDEGLAHRFVVRPDGSIAAKDGPPCGALDTLRLPGEGWRVVEAAWSPAGIATQVDAGEVPVEEAPDGAPRAAPGAPAEKPKAPMMKAGPPSVRGSLSADAVNRVLRRHANQLRFCYQKTLAKKPGLQGTVTATFVISSDGNVASAEVSEGMDEAVDACVVGRFRRMKFPQPSGGGIVSVTYPLVFSAG